LTTGVVTEQPGAAAGAAPEEEHGEPVAKARVWSSKRKRLAIVVAAAVLVCAALVYWLYERRFEDTDDAEIDANISNVSPRVSGTVTVVHVVENQHVLVGQLLAELDPADLEVAVEVAQAQLAQAEAQLEAEHPTVPITEETNKTTVSTAGSDIVSAEAALDQARKNVDQLVAQLVQAMAGDREAQIEARRAERLLADEAIPRQEYDQKEAAATSSAANVVAVREALEAARASLTGRGAAVATTQSRLAEARANAPKQLEARKASVDWRRASIDAARAQLAQAELNLSYAQIRSPVAGIVGKKSIDVGDHVAPGQQVLAITQTQEMWVTANFRETQLEKIHPGQSVGVHVDALGVTLRGSVESIGGATGSRYSVLPPENATGNYVKVVQRVPVRIALDPGQAGLDRLRPGMSVEPKVRL
jgi:membrane fusion protein (multidrug efflux system)